MAAFLKHIDDWLAGILMAAIVVVTILAVVMRYIFSRPLPWAEELTVALLVWAIMIGAVSAMKVRAHISIDALTSMLTPRTQRRIQVCNDLLSAAVLIVFGWLGVELTWGAGTKILPMLGLPYTYIDLAVPVGAFWMALYLLLDINTPRAEREPSSNPSEVAL